MNIKSKVATLVTTAALTGTAVIMPLAAVADHNTAHTIEQLQAQIAALQAQLAALSGAPAAPAGKCSFTRNLFQGVSGDDVKCLQQYLNSSGYKVADSGPGSPGSESMYYGSLTKAAVAKWQAAMGVSPAAGYFGSISRAKYDSVVAGAPAAPATPAAPGAPAAPVAVGKGLTVSAPAEQPAATLAPENAARLPMVKVVLTASADGDVTVNSVTVERQGLADDSAFVDLVLLDEDGTQIGLAKTLNALHRAVFNEKFTVKAGTSKTVTVAANMDTTGNLAGEAGQVARMAVVAVDAGASTVSGPLPIAGNGMTVNSTLAIGAVSSPTRGTLDPGAAKTALEIGSKGVFLTGVRWTVGSAEPVILEQIRFNQSSSAASGDIKNVKVRVKDTDYDTVLSSDGKYYTAKFGSGIEFDKGATIDIGVKADIESGSDREIDFDVLRRTDVVARGKTFGYYITVANGSSDPTDDSGNFSSTEPYYDAFQHKISKGSLRVEKSNAVAASNIPVDVANTSLGAFAIEAKGEQVQVTSFKVTFNGSGIDSTEDDGIDNVAIYNASGAVVAGPKDATNGVITFTDTWIVPVGLNAYTLKGKLTTDFDDGDTITASTTASSDIIARGQTTGLSITATPGAVGANTQTVRRASLKVSVGSSPAAQNVVRGINGFLFAKVQYDATASGEDLRITKQEATITTSSGADADDLNTCQIFDGANALNTGGNVVNPSGNAAGDDPEVSFAFDTHLIVPKGTLKTVDVKCNISANVSDGSTYSIGTADTDDDTVVTGANTGVSVTESLTTSVGQTMTVKTGGTLTIALDSSSPSEALAVAGKSDVTLGVLRLDAKDEAINLTKLPLQLNLNKASTTELSKVTLWDGGTKVGEAVFAGTSGFATSTLSANFIIPKDGYKTLTLKGDLASLGTGQSAVRGRLVRVNWDADDTKTEGIGQSSGTAINTAAGTDTAALGVRLVKSVPTLVKLAVPSNTLTNGDMILYRFSVAADAAGDIGLAKFTLLTATSGVQIQSYQVYGYSDSSFSVGAYASNPITQGNLNNLTMAHNTQMDVYFSPVAGSGVTSWATNDPAERIIVPAGATRYFEVRGTVTAADAGDSATVQLEGDAGVATSDGINNQETAKAVDDASSHNDFVWSPNTTTTAATTTTDWVNGYLVPGLPSTNMSSQSFSK